MNKRTMKIIDVLLKQDTYITIDNVSKILEVSNKTIRNDLLLVEEYLKENHLELVKKTGVGIYIQGSSDDKLHVLDKVKEKNKTLPDYSPTARQIFIGMQLCTFENCRIFELSELLHVSRATVHKDLLLLTDILNTYKLTLHRKNNNGISMEGKEKNIRNFLLDLMLRDNGYQLFVQIMRNENYVCDGSYVFAGMEITDDEVKDFIHTVLSSKNSYLSSLSFPSLIHIILRMFVAYQRIHDHYTIQLSDAFVNDLKAEPFYKEARDLCDRLANHYRIVISDMEIRYLQVYFLAMQTSKNLSEKEQKEAHVLTHALLRSWREQLHLPFDQDKWLYQAVFDFLCPAVIRFRHGIPNENLLMQEIHNLYEHTFQVTKKSVACIEEFFHCKVSDDEIGFLSLFLAASLEHMKQPLQTIVVSHGGIGASTLLCRKLESQIPEIQIISTETFFSIYECDLSPADLIISTMDLNIKTDKPIIQVNSLLHDYDFIRLKNIVQKYYKIKNDPYNFKNDTGK